MYPQTPMADDPFYEPEWCENCGATGHNEMNCPYEDDDDWLDESEE